MTTDLGPLGLDVEPTPLALLLLGRQSDPDSERGTACPGDLPAPSDPSLVERARAAKAALGDNLFVLGHHYQRDEVIQFADVTGDSFKLAREAAARPEASYVVFCGVHFMAESADILTGPDQQVVLPDLAAGCSMADMASAEQVAEAWDVLTDAGVADVTVRMSADSAMKCTPQKTMYDASGRAAASRASLKESPVTSANWMTSSRW